VDKENFVIFILLGNSTASELYMLTFRNTLSVPSLFVYENGTECSETSAYKIQTPGNYPEENIQHTEHGESLKSRNQKFSYIYIVKRTCFRGIHSYCSYCNIGRVTKSRNINWTVHVASLKNMKSV
jgi:hypothetical protein